MLKDHYPYFSNRDALIENWKKDGSFSTMTVHCCSDVNLCNKDWTTAGGPATNNPNDVAVDATGNDAAGTGDSQQSAKLEEDPTGASGSGANCLIATVGILFAAVLMAIRF